MEDSYSLCTAATRWWSGSTDDLAKVGQSLRHPPTCCIDNARGPRALVTAAQVWAARPRRSACRFGQRSGTRAAAPRADDDRAGTAHGRVSGADAQPRALTERLGRCPRRHIVPGRNSHPHRSTDADLRGSVLGNVPQLRPGQIDRGFQPLLCRIRVSLGPCVLQLLHDHP